MARHTEKGVNLRNVHCRTGIMARTLKNMKNEKQTLSELEYGEKTKKLGKMRHTHLRTKNMARNSENVKNETYTL